MSDLTETPSGLLVPTSALPPVEVPPLTSEINPFEIIFPSKETAEKFISRCVVRWTYLLSHYNSAKEDEPDNWKVHCRKGKGIVHDSWSPVFTKDDFNDDKLGRYVDIVEMNEKAFRIVNKP